MLGSDVVAVFTATGIPVMGIDIKDCDITDVSSVRAVFTQLQPTHVIHCAAYTDVDGAESDRELAKAVNVTGAEHVALVCHELGARMTLISTDYVFDGMESGYDETALRNPINYYGVTKAEAEQVVLAVDSTNSVVRTSWLFGRQGKNFVDTISALASSRETLAVVADQVGSPTYTVDLAAALSQMYTQEPGIYHLTNDGVCSWFEFATEIVRLTGYECTVTPCTSAEYPQVAKRPACSVLRNNKVAVLPTWQTGVTQYMHNMHNKNL